VNRNTTLHQDTHASTPETRLRLALWGGWLVGVLLLATVWLPTRIRSKPLETRLTALQTQIALQTGSRPHADLLGAVRQLEADSTALKSRLAYWIDRRHTFTRPRPDNGFIQQQDDGRIDFKIALFNARATLLARADDLNATIPETLGIDETLSTDTRVETALGQLSATVRLVEKAMAAGIRQVEAIQPQPPRMRGLLDASVDRLREYPTRIQTTGDFATTLTLLAQLADTENGYALERFSIEKRFGTESESPLTIHLQATAGRPLRQRPPSTDRDAPPAPVSSDEPTETPMRKSMRAPVDVGEPLRSTTNAWMREVDR